MWVPFWFNVLDRLANISTRISLYELLQLLKVTRDALREALADLVQIAEPSIGDEDSCPNYDQTTRKIPYITFSPEDMQIKNLKDNRPLYYSRYVSSAKVNRIHVDPDFALSIIPRRLIQFLGISFSRLTPINTTIYGFNTTAVIPWARYNFNAKLEI